MLSFFPRCKIDVARQCDRDDSGLVQVALRGTSEQVETARRLIEEVVAEVEQKRPPRHAPRTPRLSYRQPLFLTSDSACPSQEVLSSSPAAHGQLDQYERLQPAMGFQKMGVFVANVIDPERFFVQKVTIERVKKVFLFYASSRVISIFPFQVGPSSIALDKLVQEMTLHYEDPINASRDSLGPDTAPGDLVAAKFPGDGQFYRAKVVDVSVDEYDEESAELDLDFVDFGDSGTAQKRDVFQLRTEFLKLSFQAIECCIHNIKPV